MKLQFLNLKQRYNLKDYKFTLILLVLAVSVIGVFMVGSANAEYQPRQIMGVGLGLLAMVVISLIDYKWILNFYWLMYVVNIALLLAVIFLGTEANGATRWLDLGFVQFQPSDLTKLITILFFARFLADREEQINKKKTILEAIGLIIPSLLLVYKQPSLSATICIAALFCVIMFMAGLSYKFIGTVLAITIPTIALVIGIVVQPNQPFLKDIMSIKKRLEQKSAINGKAGVAIMSDMLNDEKIRNLVIKHYNSITCENEMKPEIILGDVPVFSVDTEGSICLDENGDPVLTLDFSKADKIMDFIKKHNEKNPDDTIRVRGHVLVWHSQTPDWFFREKYDSQGAYVGKEKMLKRLENYIQKVIEHYDGVNSPYRGIMPGM